MAWLGQNDLNASSSNEGVGEGPIAGVCAAREYDSVVLLNNYPKARADQYCQWLNNKLNLSKQSVSILQQTLSSPVNYAEIFQAARKALVSIRNEDPDSKITFHLSPGTPAMAAIWIILAQMYPEISLINSSREAGVEDVDFPFDIAAEFYPDVVPLDGKKLVEMSAGLPPQSPEFDLVVHRSDIMKQLVAKSRLISRNDVPVLLEGETGTGKELFARAIHAESQRHDKPLIALNCGAIPTGLLESELFGHEKGAYTGADRQRKGKFEEADGGTLFLDEIGELPKPAQVALLRALQSGEITRVGSSQTIRVDVRIIAATNRNLLQEVVEGNFREDLFYRLGVAILELPPLREREGDLGLLIDHLLKQIARESQMEAGKMARTLSSSARRELLRHHWPGNVRELSNTLLRASVWSSSEELTLEDIRTAILKYPETDSTLPHAVSFGGDFNAQDFLSDMRKQLAQQALDRASGNKAEAAKLLGLPNYQTLTNWLK